MMKVVLSGFICHNRAMPSKTQGNKSRVFNMSEFSAYLASLAIVLLFVGFILDLANRP